MNKLSTRSEIFQKCNVHKITAIDWSREAGLYDEENKMYRSAWQEGSVYLRISFEDGTVLLSEIQE
jgi:hypothetical protein